MFDYIKKQFSERMEAMNPVTENDDTELVVECAHLFEELSDLTVEGDDSKRDRRISIDIPIEDDIEIDSIEINVTDGRITDVPMDATVQESKYDRMKTYGDFYQEACLALTPFMRESNEAFENRKHQYASKKMSEYKNFVVQEGLFGFDKLSFDDSRIPAKLTVDFGPMSSDNENQHYFVKLKVLFEVDKKDKILKKQLDSINIAQSEEVFIALGKVLPELIGKKYPEQMANVKSVWDVLTPVKLIVPVDPIDEHKIVVGFECDFTDEILYYSWSRPVNKARITGKVNVDPVDSNNASKLTVKSKNEYIKESHELRRPSRFGSIYQEAIEFGNLDPDSPTPPSNVDDNNEPAVSNDDPNAGADPVVDGQNQSPDETVPVDTNNVSDQIAEKVSAETNGDGDNLDNVTDIPVDADPSTDPDPAMDGDMNGDGAELPTDDSSTDPMDPASADQQLEDLDNAGNTDLSLDDGSTGDVDIENMTIDELLAQGSEKLKGMTIEQLKGFLSGSGSDMSMGDTPDTDALQEAFVNGTSETVFQEALILTKKNINKEIDIHLRKSLGILNDGEMDLSTLITEFKKEGKKLNRVLSKASKMNKVYSDEERENIGKLNKCLTDLMTTLKVSKSESDTAVIKRLIQAFTSQSKVVAKLVEDKTKGEDKPVQESAVYQEGLFLSSSNAKKRLSRKMIPVYHDIKSIAGDHKAGRLTKGKLTKMYKPKTGKRTTATYGTGYGNNVANANTTEYEINTPEMNRLDALMRIIEKILRKKKVQSAFASDELHQVEELYNSLDQFVDFVESLIADSSEKESLIDQVGKDAVSIVALMSEIYNFCEGTSSASNNTNGEKPIDKAKVEDSAVSEDDEE